MYVIETLKINSKDDLKFQNSQTLANVAINSFIEKKVTLVGVISK